MWVIQLYFKGVFFFFYSVTWVKGSLLPSLKALETHYSKLWGPIMCNVRF